MGQTRKAFVGIDVAIAKKKPLPISVCIEDAEGHLDILPLKRGFRRPPVGRGNRAALHAEDRRTFAEEVRDWLDGVTRQERLVIECIAIDAPSHHCRPGLERRECEQALDRAGISCFATPTVADFQSKVAASRKHLDDGKELSRLPNANQLWMLVGFDLFRTLEAEHLCLETYPQAIVRRLRCADRHKSTNEGLRNQLDCAARLLGTTVEEFRGKLDSMGYGSTHDKLDAFLSCWVASLGDRRECYGDPEMGDAIWVPKLPPQS